MLPLASIEKIARKIGVERISVKALKELEKIVEELGLELAREAANAARYAKRKTILKDDIKLVAGKM